MQTQEAFYKIVKDTLVQDDDSVSISNMRGAIKQTNVVLDLTVLPGVTLIPSKMLILDEPIAGYNNTLTIATKHMKFGVNEKVNFLEEETTTQNITPAKEKTRTVLRTSQNKTPTPVASNNRKSEVKKDTNIGDPHDDEMKYVFGVLLVGVAAIWKLLL